MNAYDEEQDYLDIDLKSEELFWAAVQEVEEIHGFQIRVRLTDGEPHIYAEKVG